MERARGVLALAEEAETPTRSPIGVTRARRARKVQETVLALKLRKAGHSYSSIAETLSSQGRPCSAARANRIVLQALQGLERMQDAEALQLRNLELERLDEWQLRLETRIDQGDPKAIQTALMVQGRRLALQGMPLAAMQGASVSSSGDATGQERVEGGGLGLLAYAELRVGLGAGSGQGVEALRGLLSQALQAGAMRALPAHQAEQPALPARAEVVDLAPLDDSPTEAEDANTGGDECAS